MALQNAISKEIFELASQLTPGGVHSAARAFLGMGITPLIAKQGIGDILIDADDNQYIDYVQSWGALILGHADPDVRRAVHEQVDQGTSFGVSTKLEYELSRAITQFLPSMEKVRFVSSGTEAAMTAIRLARAFSEKPFLLKFDGHYHGHADPLLVSAGSAAMASSLQGVPPQQTLSIPANDIPALEKAFATYEIGAVIIEPIAGNMGVVRSQPQFLQRLQELCKSKGAVLIFDEVISGFRVGPQGAQGLYGITPDLTCLGKIIGGGFPCAALGGRAEIMDHLTPLGKVFQAGTLSGNPVAMAAGLATLKKLQDPKVYAELERKTSIVTDGIACEQIGSMFSIFDRTTPLEIFRAYFHHMLKKGIYMPQALVESSFVSLAHTDEHLQQTRAAIEEFLCI